MDDKYCRQCDQLKPYKVNCMASSKTKFSFQFMTVLKCTGDNILAIEIARSFNRYELFDIVHGIRGPERKTSNVKKKLSGIQFFARINRPYRMTPPCTEDIPRDQSYTKNPST